MAIFSDPSRTQPLQVADREEARKKPISREELVMATDPRGPLAEQFRTLRNSVTALNPEGASRTVVMTSARRGEGKTVATLNLGIAMAEMPGSQILVVDANLHSPSTEDYLEIPRRQGLADLLAGRIDLDQATRPTSIEGLSILGAGTQPRNPSELLASERMHTVLSMLKQRYRYVLIDTPEAMAISDASLLGAVADGIILVVRLGTTPRHYVEQTHQLLESLGGNVLGTCLTHSTAEARPSKEAPKR